MIDFFVRPWEISGEEKIIELPDGPKTPHELRKMLYENIVDEAMYIARGAEGAVSLDWVMDQPVFIRKKYFKQMKEEIEDRNRRLNTRKSNSKSGVSKTRVSSSV